MKGPDPTGRHQGGVSRLRDDFISYAAFYVLLAEGLDALRIADRRLASAVGAHCEIDVLR